jgi:YhcH/YjgK/YiaL family protein
MILGELETLKNHIELKNFDSIIMFIDKVKANDVVIGEWIILNEELKALVLCKSGYVDGVFESHTVFNDIHIVIDGSDTIYLGDKSQSSIKTPYDEKGDYTLYFSEILTSCKMNKNSFAFIPKEVIHTNQIEGEYSKKIVVKIK